MADPRPWWKWLYVVVAILWFTWIAPRMMQQIRAEWREAMRQFRELRAKENDRG